jgi:hypothetical protein
MFLSTFKAGLISFVLLAALGGSTVHTQSTPVRNIVLVHGAWVDGSG